jgi:DnaJ-class molecular chaperone
LTYQELQKALKIFGFDERASQTEIKDRYRQLAKRHHPDRHQEPVEPEAIQLLNAAYALLCAYCEHYRYCFTEEEFFEQNPEERMRWQFATDPLWGRGETPNDDDEC